VVQRNTVGSIAARALWSSIMLDLTNRENILFGFVDEAAIATETSPHNGYSFNSKTEKCETCEIDKCITGNCNFNSDGSKYCSLCESGYSYNPKTEKCQDCEIDHCTAGKCNFNSDGSKFRYF